MNPTPYKPKTGDLVLRPDAIGKQYAIVHVTEGSPKQYSFTPLSHAELLQWSFLGGRFPQEIACNNPCPPKDPPKEILQVTGFEWKSKAKVVARNPLPASISEIWGKASAEDARQIIREFIKSEYQESQLGRPWDEEYVDKLVQKRMRLPQGCGLRLNMPKIT